MIFFTTCISNLTLITFSSFIFFLINNCSTACKTSSDDIYNFFLRVFPYMYRSKFTRDENIFTTMLAGSIHNLFSFTCNNSIFILSTMLFNRLELIANQRNHINELTQFRDSKFLSHFTLIDT